MIPWEEPPGKENARAFVSAVLRLERGEPVQYVCGKAPFMDFEVRVTPDTLIPRPETEQLVTLALGRVVRPGDRVLDVGTGSGCIAIAVKRALPSCVVAAVDISIAALEIARGNADALGTEIRFKQADLLEGQSQNSWDVIIANLPYVGENEREQLPEEVRDHEPSLALFAGEDGTSLVTNLLYQARGVLAPGGRVVLETGENQGETYRRVARELGWKATAYNDLAGRERFWLFQPIP